MTNALEVRDLSKSYGDFHLDSVSFTLPVGYIMGFVGQNGAGKTTTIRLILNMAPRLSGQVSIFGLDNIHDDLAVKEKIGAVFDEIFFIGSWQVRQVEKALKGFYPQWDSTVYADLLQKFDLPLTKQVAGLSRGMKMKLMLAVAMCHGASLLILDEPTSGLDPVARDELLDILRDYIADGDKSVFFSTHITSDLERIADFITLIDHGRIFYTGTKDGLLESYAIVRGAKEDLTDKLKHDLIGLTMTHSGFEGMLAATDIKDLPKQVVTEEPEIDEILVHIAKEADHHDA